MSQIEIEKQKFYGWRNVFICFLCYFLVYGVVFYGFSVVFPAMVKAMDGRGGTPPSPRRSGLFLSVSVRRLQAT